MQLRLLPTVALVLSLAMGASAANECRFQTAVAYEQPVNGDTWHHQMSVTSAGECCGRCRGIAECYVGMYQTHEPRHIGGGNWNISGTCWMRGQVDLTKPTAKENVTACVVGTRPAPTQAAPAGAKNVLYMVSDDCRPELRACLMLFLLCSTVFCAQNAVSDSKLWSGLHQSTEPRCSCRKGAISIEESSFPIEESSFPIEESSFPVEGWLHLYIKLTGSDIHARLLPTIDLFALTK